MNRVDIVEILHWFRAMIPIVRPALYAEPASEERSICQREADRWLAKGKEALIAKDYKLAIPLLKTAYALDPLNHRISLNLARAHIEMGDFHLGVSAAARALEVVRTELLTSSQ